MVKNGFMALAGQRPPLDLSGYDVVVFPGVVFQAARYAEDLIEYRDVQDIELIAHLPACYMKPRYQGMFWDMWKALADGHGGWLQDERGEHVVDRSGSHFLDMRASTGLARKFAYEIVKWLERVSIAEAGGQRLEPAPLGCMPTGIFLDCTWDDIWGTARHFGHPLAGDRDEINCDWQLGQRQFIASLRFKSRKLFDERPLIYGNGTGSYGYNLLDGLCYESWPVGWYGVNNPNRNAHTALVGNPDGGGRYGLKWHNSYYRMSPMLIPRGTAPGDGVTPEDAVLARAWLGEYAKEDEDECCGTVFENSGVLIGL